MRLPILDAEVAGVHDWRQSQTMWNVRNYVRYDANLLNARVSSFNGDGDNLYRYELPLLQYGIALGQRIFGEEMWVARLSVWLVSTLGLVGFFGWLRTCGVGEWAAAGGTALLQFSPLFYFYSVNPLPDLLALAAGCWYLFAFCRWLNGGRRGWLLGAGAALSVAALAKLPFLLFGVVGLLAFLMSWRFTLRIWPGGRVDRIIQIGSVHAIALVPVVAWYAWVMPGWEGNPVLQGVFDGQTDWGEYLAILKHHLVCSFPHALLSPAAWVGFGIGAVVGRAKFPVFAWGLAGMCFLYLVLQWDVIGVVHDYYLLPFLPWMYLVVAAGMDRLISYSKIGRAIAVATVLVAPFLAHMLRHEDWSPGRGYAPASLYAIQEELRAIGHPDDLAIVLNDGSGHVFPWLIRKRGFVFADDALDPAWIDDMRDNYGAKWFYSNSRVVDEDPAFRGKLGEMVFAGEGVRVFDLDVRQ